jgi:integrase
MSARDLFDRAGKLPFDGSSNLAEFASAEYLATLDAEVEAQETRFVKTAVRHFTSYLKRAPRVNDLSGETLQALCFWLLEQGCARGTIDRYREVLRRVARRAVACGILPAVPRVKKFRSRWKKPQSPPYSRAELNRIFAAARTAPGEAAPGFPARDWWPAVLFAVLDLQTAAPALLMLPVSAFDAERGTLKSGLFIHCLQPRTIEALRALGTEPRARLFPWDRDSGKPPFCQFYYHLREILWRASVPSRARNVAERLRQTGINDPEAIARIKLDGRIVLRELTSRHPRRRPDASFRHAPSSAAAPNGFGRNRRKGRKPRRKKPAPAPMGFPPSNEKTRAARRANREPDCYLIETTAERKGRTVLEFFNNVYVPKKGAEFSPDSATSYRSGIRRLNDFCCCNVSLDALSDDLIEDFVAWLASRGYPPATRKRICGEILAVWRFAWRKKFVETQPRDIDRIRLPKTVPDAWSVAQVGKLLSVAAETEGHVSGFRASIYWPALLLLIYDTGFRIRAVMKLKTSDLDLEAGWVKAHWDTQKQKADQVLPLFKDTVELLRQMAAEQPGREMVFPFPFKTSACLTDRLRLLLQRAGLPHGKRDLFHKLRRTNGTYVADVAGEEAAMRQLGHSHVNVTRSYIDPRKLTTPRIVDSMQRPTPPRDPSPAGPGIPAAAPAVPFVPRLFSPDREAS